MNYPIQPQDSGYTILTDRLCVYFNTMKGAKNFIKRNQKFLDHMHTLPNHAGLIFVLDKNLGLDKCKDQNYIFIYAKALGLTEDPSEQRAACMNVNRDDLADAVINILPNKWDITPRTNFEEPTGTYDSFRDFFLKNQYTEPVIVIA